jgi:hypothetical protein
MSGVDEAIRIDRAEVSGNEVSGSETWVVGVLSATLPLPNHGRVARYTSKWISSNWADRINIKRLAGSFARPEISVGVG